jgi:hypothetical protein
MPQLELIRFFAILSLNLLKGLFEVTIPETFKTSPSAQFVLYVIKVRRLDPESGWIVPRRYSEFHSLHHRLREKYPAVANVEFPGKRMAKLFGKQSTTFVENRRAALEIYLMVRLGRVFPLSFLRCTCSLIDGFLWLML